MIPITSEIYLQESEITFSFIAARGPGGQNVNKVATAVQLRFDINNSSLPMDVRERLVSQLGKKLTKNGEIIIKAFRHRTQERNKQDAIERLCEMIKRAAIPPKKRKKTKPSRAAKKRRLDSKKIHGQKKLLRRMI